MNKRHSLMRKRDHAWIALWATVDVLVFFFIYFLVIEVAPPRDESNHLVQTIVYLASPILAIYLVCFMVSRAAEKRIRKTFVPEAFPFLACPHCGALYKDEEYRRDVLQIFCSACKRELPQVNGGPNRGGDHYGSPAADVG